MSDTSGIVGNAENGRNSRKKAQKTQKEKCIGETGAFCAGREPPFRHWPANVTKRPSQPEALSCLVQSLPLLFLRFLRLFAAISASVFPLQRRVGNECRSRWTAYH